ncbi:MULTISPECIES: DUF1109 domain-containing protein [Haloarcula]|uniref:DUF1109 domain-containing protein n=1 Tax=Haloarcula TaxID=2237 RepID=UPI0023EC430C|nr:DUF1109 domain-containing protein [Halomicroarcula sp. XH51]
MNFDIDSGKLLYALGVLFAAAALLYFVRDVVFGLSITVKAALLLLAFVVFFVTGVAVQRDVLDVVAFALSGIAYVVFVGYVVVRYDPGETGTFLLLAASAAVFLGLGYGLRVRELTVSRRTATAVVAALVVLSTVLIGVDAVGGGVTYDLETESSVTVDPPPRSPDRGYVPVEVTIGTVTASNEFVFTRALDRPDLRGCLLGVPDPPTRELWVGYESTAFEQGNTIRGQTTLTFDVRADVLVDVNRTEPLGYAVERGEDCESERTSPTLLVWVEDGRD